MNKVFKVGLIGCGHISETYFRAQEYFNNIRIIKCADINMESAKKCAIHYNIEAVTVEEILKDKDIEIILNLTIPRAHYEVSRMALENGKHSYAEKPMAVNFEDGKKLLEISKSNKLYIGNAPDTFLGGGIQKSKELVEKNIIGNVKLGNAVFAFPGIQSYHPNPEPWFTKKEGGPVIDMGPYYITALVNLLGPAKKVTGTIIQGQKYRTIGIGPKKGKKFKVECPTTYLSTITFKNNSVIRLTLSFDVIAHQRNHIELYGEKGSMIVPDPNMFGGSVLTCNKLGDNWKEFKTTKMPLGRINIRTQSSRANETPTNANYRGVGLSEMAYSIENKRKHLCSGEISLHVLDIITSIMKAARSGKIQNINTLCAKPKKFSELDIKKLLK